MRVKLGDIFEIGSGGTPSKSHPEYYGGNIPWVKTGDLKNEYLYEAEDFITEEGLNNSSAKMYEADTVLIAMYGATIGATSILKIDACTNQACAAFKKNEQVIPEYLYYFLQSKKEKFVKDGVGGAQPNISAGYLKKVEMELPSLEEQREIVDILDKTSDIMVKRNREINSLDDLIKARFVEMFGSPVSNPFEWKRKTLKEVCVKLNDGTHFSPESFESGEYKYVTAKNIKLSGFDFTNITYVPEEVHRPIYDRCNPELGDVLYIKDGATTGIAMVNTLEEEFTLLSSVALLKQDRAVMNGYFLTSLLNNEDMYSDIRNNMGGAAITRLTIAKLNAIKVIVPPIELQNQFADFVHQVDKSKLCGKLIIYKKQGGKLYGNKF